MFTNISPSSKVTPTIPPMPAIPEDCTGAVLADRKASPSEQVQKEQEEERQILYRKVEELERRNESLKEAVANLTVRTPSPAGMAQRENASDAITTDRTASPAGMAQREEASAEKEAFSVRELIQAAMRNISEGKFKPGERISVERSELGTTVLIETLA